MSSASKTRKRQVRCVTYKDEFSADKSSYNDMMIGVKDKVVGCGSKKFGASTDGDIVIITSNMGKTKFFTIGFLKDRLEICKLWQEAGGRMWDYNFTYEPLVGVYELTPRLQRRINKICAGEGEKSTYLFHSLFCGEKRYGLVVDKLVTYLQDKAKQKEAAAAAAMATKGQLEDSEEST